MFSLWGLCLCGVEGRCVHEHWAYCFMLYAPSVLLPWVESSRKFPPERGKDLAKRHALSYYLDSIDYS